MLQWKYIFLSNTPLFPFCSYLGMCFLKKRLGILNVTDAHTLLSHSFLTHTQVKERVHSCLIVKIILHLLHRLLSTNYRVVTYFPRKILSYLNQNSSAYTPKESHVAKTNENCITFRRERTLCVLFRKHMHK